MYSIAIDGPAGAGKSTIAKTIAKKLEFIYVDTGAMYRAIALYMLRNNMKQEEEVATHVKEASVEIVYQKKSRIILYWRYKYRYQLQAEGIIMLQFYLCCYKL